MNFKKTMLAVPMSLALLVPTAGVASVSAQQKTADKPTVSTPASDLRIQLDKLFSEHAYLAIEAMRKGYDDSDDFKAAANELSNNTSKLKKAISSVYGDDAGQQFEKMWSAHIGYFVDYVKATANKSDDDKQKALDNLKNYRQDFSQFLDKATEGKADASDVSKALQGHVDQLLKAFNAYVDGDYQKAYDSEREAIHHMYGIGKTLSWAITMQYPDKFDKTSVATPAADLRADMSYLLSEHAALAVDAMQNGIDDSDDFKASAQALAENTDDLSDAIGGVYGDDAGKQFKKMWSGHIADFVDYVKATASKDDGMKKDAKSALDKYSMDFAKFLSDATDGKVKSEAAQEGLQTHVKQLLDAFNNYNDEDYDKAYENVAAAYEHMFPTAESISGAIVMQFPDKFMDKNMPNEMPSTGMGGTANSAMFDWVLVATLVIAAGAAVYVMEKRVRKS